MDELVTFKMIKNDEEVKALLAAVNKAMDALHYTEHSVRHCSIVSKWTGEILEACGFDERTVELGLIAGYLHDIGNIANRHDHAQVGAVMAYNLLTKKGMSPAEAAEIMMAIGNHDENHGVPVNDICSAVIIADKSDVHKSRMRNKVVDFENMNIHDRVNYAAETSYVEVGDDYICTHIDINQEISSVMDYFEIYTSRMQMCRRAAKFLNRDYTLVINNVRLL